MGDKLSLKKICNDCGSRCCYEGGPPIVYDTELERIRTELTKKNMPDFIERVEGKPFHTIPRSDGYCPYVENGNCSIQNVKPMDCRIYPVGLTPNSDVGVSSSCPAKNLITPEFIKSATTELEQLRQSEKKQLAGFNVDSGYAFTKFPSNFGLELLLDLYGCNPEIMSSREKLIQYNEEIVKVIGMVAVGEPIIPEKYGKGTLYGYSSVQFIQTSSVVTHICEPMLEVHVDIFSCRTFDAEKATDYTTDFFKARKTKKQIVTR